ncbi:DUF6126 family protein [Streptomyces candidus]|uniref:Uncharacterized protein n=1 Tax=Streptomyces candidus TaxID=67283 RepID=A0A7X0LQ51_9ACTN|nr:DUF6126 family protein [Streptomyces candidus]MBB6436665.1 hypothetical protein [Streptomyces candidus]GHH50979.1 hypothetical protein GCM10018773_48780 [Streptomyces candidus]
MAELTESQNAAMAAIARAADEMAREGGPDSRKADWNDGAGSSSGVLGFVEDKAPRGLVLRVFLYVAVGHVFAAFIYLLFTLGGEG